MPDVPDASGAPGEPDSGPEGSGSSDHLVWVDLEMTGLDVTRDVIVEIAVVVTDSELRALDDGIDIVVHQPPEVLERMDEFVRRMHTRSGLLPEIEASTVSLEAAGRAVVEYLRRLLPEPGRAPMCGNSIGVDRRFLDRQLPEVDRLVHYRSVDVSTLKELCRRWYPQQYRRRPRKAEAHRALDDIRESIEELRFYRSAILIPPTAGEPSSTGAPPSDGAGPPSGEPGSPG